MEPQQQQEPTPLPPPTLTMKLPTDVDDHELSAWNAESIVASFQQNADSVFAVALWSAQHARCPPKSNFERMYRAAYNLLSQYACCGVCTTHVAAFWQRLQLQYELLEKSGAPNAHLMFRDILQPWWNMAPHYLTDIYCNTLVLSVNAWRAHMATLRARIQRLTRRVVVKVNRTQEEEKEAPTSPTKSYPF